MPAELLILVVKLRFFGHVFVGPILIRWKHVHDVCLLAHELHLWQGHILWVFRRDVQLLGRDEWPLIVQRDVFQWWFDIGLIVWLLLIWPVVHDGTYQRDLWLQLVRILLGWLHVLILGWALSNNVAAVEIGRLVLSLLSLSKLWLSLLLPLSETGEHP